MTNDDADRSASEEDRPVDQTDRIDAGRRTGPGRGHSRPRAAGGPTFPESTLLVSPWPDPVLDQLGHDPRSGYVERFWLPVLGPSCLLLVRRLAAELERQPDGHTLDTCGLARELGLGMKGGRHSPFWRALDRTGRFGATQRHGARLAVRRRLPPLTSRQVARLPQSLSDAHEAWLAARLAQPRRATVSRWTPDHHRVTAADEERDAQGHDFPDAA